MTPAERRLRAGNPIPDPQAAVDPAAARTLLDGILSTPRQAPRRRRRGLRVALAAGVAAAAVFAGLLALGSDDRVPDRFGVLAAFAQELRRDGQILHIRTSDEASNVTEAWVLLEDPSHQRWILDPGPRRIEQAIDGSLTTVYLPGMNTVWRGGEPPLDVRPSFPFELAKVALSDDPGSMAVGGPVKVHGRPAFRLRAGRHLLYVARDAPVLLRADLLGRDGRRVGRREVSTYELLPADPRLLTIDLPPDVRTGATDPPHRPELSPADRRAMLAAKRACSRSDVRDCVERTLRRSAEPPAR